MSCSLWAYLPHKCDGGYCCGDCDNCDKAENTILDEVKAVIQEHFEDGDCGIYDTPNIAGDWMDCIYQNENVKVLICYQWAYFEVFGLSNEEFKDLEKFYHKMRGW